MSERTPFNINTEDWTWSDEVEGQLKQLVDNIALDIAAGLQLSLDVYLTKYIEKQDGGFTRGNFLIEAYIYDEASGETPARKYITLTKMVDGLDLDPKEVAYARESFQHLADEFDALAKRIRAALELADAE